MHLPYLLGLLSPLHAAVAQQRVVDRYLPELVLYHGELPAVARRQEVVHEGRLPAPEEPSDDGYGQARPSLELLAPLRLPLLPEGCLPALAAAAAPVAAGTTACDRVAAPAAPVV